MSRPRHDGRTPEDPRPIRFERGFTNKAQGSVLTSFGETRVLCTASVIDSVPHFLKGKARGWLTAEYSMLPSSTGERKTRDRVGKIDGRSVEIQRLIGRALRSVVDLKAMTERTIWIDCDVLQADGGTRTASITGAYLAARLAVQKLLDEGVLKENPFTDSVAAVSVGVYQGEPVLDLPYLEDRDASVDCNVVMTGKGAFVELQGSGEEATFSEEELGSLIVLAKKGIKELSSLQAAFLSKRLLGDLKL